MRTLSTVFNKILDIQKAENFAELLERYLRNISLTDFDWSGNISEEMQKGFDENGFLILRQFLDKEEIEQMWRVVRDPDGILKHSFMTVEENGQRIQTTLCNYPGTDVTGMLARSEKVAGTSETLLGYDVYHWCSMFVIKDARVGGEHVWHQDYGYWYNDGCLYPDMITVWIPLEKCTKDNSCKQVLRSSHKMGRINHSRVVSGQIGADVDRVELIKKKCEHIYLEMEAGDAFIHHGNTLHRSDVNVSDRGRCAFMSCFNAVHNSPVVDSAYPAYNKLEKVPNAAIRECRNYTDFSGKEFREEV